MFYSLTRGARNEQIERIGRNESNVRNERNERDERIWRNTFFVFPSKRLRRIEGALYFIEASKAQV